MSFVNEYNPNIRELADTLFLGPQAELLEEVDSFNRIHCLDLGLTPKFNWRPGTYPKVNQYIQRILMLDRKCSGLSKMGSRVEQADWRLRRFKEALERIESKISHMRSEGIHWRDNSDDIETVLGALKHRVESQLEQVPDKLGVEIDVIYW